MTGTEGAPGVPAETSSVAGARVPRWVLAIVIGLVLMGLVNFVFIYLALSDADQVVPSYLIEQR